MSEPSFIVTYTTADGMDVTRYAVDRRDLKLILTKLMAKDSRDLEVFKSVEDIAAELPIE